MSMDGFVVASGVGLCFVAASCLGLFDCRGSSKHSQGFYAVDLNSPNDPPKPLYNYIMAAWTC